MENHDSSKRTLPRWIIPCMIIGSIAVLQWVATIVYLFWLGYSDSWISDKFFNIEGISFLQCAVMLIVAPLTLAPAVQEWAEWLGRGEITND